MKKMIMLFLMVLFVGLVGCNSTLVTHRTVEKMNETTKDDYYQTEFTNLDGRTVIRAKKNNSEGAFKCTGNISKGSITVKYIDPFDNEIPLFTLNEDEDIDDYFGYIDSNSTGYLVIETNEVASGNLHIMWN